MKDGKRFKVLVSTGLGRLHFMQAVQSVRSKKFLVSIIQGWVPGRYFPTQVIRFLARFTGSPHLHRSIRKRMLPPGVVHENISLSGVEFLCHFLLITLSRMGLMKRDRILYLTWKIFGLQTRKYAKNADILHVRSGAGGGVIKFCKTKNITVLVDHSIAHPFELAKQLNRFKNFEGAPYYDHESDFWRQIALDCRLADHILVNSDYVKATFIKHGFKEHTISVIYHGVSQDFLNLKPSFKLNGEVNILFTGNFGFRKGAVDVLAFMREAIKKNKAYKLHVVGNSQEVQHLVDNDIAKHIVFYGVVAQEDLKQHIATCDIYLFPSLAEGCAASGMEAMAGGIPVITTVNSGLPVVNGHSGIVINTNSPTDIGDAVEKLVGSEDLRTKLGMNASKTIEQYFSWDNYGIALECLYEELASDKI